MIMEQQEDQRSESSELLALNVGNETIYTYTMSMKRPPTVNCGKPFDFPNERSA